MKSIRYLNCFVMERMIQNYIHKLRERFFVVGLFQKSARFEKVIKGYIVRLNCVDLYEMLITSIFISDDGAGHKVFVRDDHPKSMCLRCWQHIASKYDSSSSLIYLFRADDSLLIIWLLQSERSPTIVECIKDCLWMKVNLVLVLKVG